MKSHLRFEEDENIVKITTNGELSDEQFLPGGVAYRYDYQMTKNSLKKIVTLRYHDRKPDVAIVEPIVLSEGVTIKKQSDTEVQIASPKKTITLRVEGENAELVMGEDAERFWFPFPGLKAYPVKITIKTPKDGFQEQVTLTYEID